MSARFCERYSHTNDSTCVLHEGDEDVNDTFVLGDIEVYTNFITQSEEEFLVGEIDGHEWKMSQSGRCKQDYGPQVNFKRKKVKLGNFNGLPSYSEFLVTRLKSLQSSCKLSTFRPVELCNLEYRSERGSSIDAHVDDTWMWGEQLVTVNLLSATILTLTNSNVKHNNRHIENDIC